MIINEFLHRTFLENTVESFCWFFGIILLGLIFKKLLSKLFALCVFRFLKKYSEGVGYNKLFLLLKKPFEVLIFLISIYLAFDRLHFPEQWNIVTIEHFGLRLILSKLFQIVIVSSITWILLRIVDFLGVVFKHRAKQSEPKTDDQLVPFVKDAIKVFITIFSFFFILGTIFDLNIASLIAGLGIGGLAVALAAKESLENLFGSFTIFLDKPFTIGDLIRVGNVEGNVEKIGFRSTRIRTAEKSYVTVPNKKMVDTELDNLSMRMQRRAKFNVGLTYETKAEQFKNIIKEIKTSLENHPSVIKTDMQVILHDFDASAINILVCYFVDTMDYDFYLNIREEINYTIMKIVEKNGSSFAYPTTSVWMNKKEV